MQTFFIAILLACIWTSSSTPTALSGHQQLRKRVADLRPWPYLRRAVVDILIEVEIIRFNACRDCIFRCPEYQVSVVRGYVVNAGVVRKELWLRYHLLLCGGSSTSRITGTDVSNGVRGCGSTRFCLIGSRLAQSLTIPRRSSSRGCMTGAREMTLHLRRNFQGTL